MLNEIVSASPLCVFIRTFTPTGTVFLCVYFSCVFFCGVYVVVAKRSAPIFRHSLKRSCTPCIRICDQSGVLYRYVPASEPPDRASLFVASSLVVDAWRCAYNVATWRCSIISSAQIDYPSFSVHYNFRITSSTAACAVMQHKSRRPITIPVW